MFLEIIKAILMGIVEGITEWLPISSTGHMILLEQVVKFNASEEFMSMFRVVIQLGAILAVVVLFWGKLWPFGLRHGRVISKPSVWQLWFKVVAATLPVLVISRWTTGWRLTSITTSPWPQCSSSTVCCSSWWRAAALRPTSPIWNRSLTVTPSSSASGRCWPSSPAPPVPARPSWAACCWASPALRGGVHLLPRHPGHGGRIPAQGAQIRRLRCHHHRHRGGCADGGLRGGFVVSLAAIRFLMDYVKRHNFTFFGIYRIALGLVVLAVAVVSAMV